MAAVVAAARVVGEVGAEDGRDGVVFVEDGEASGGVVGEERGGCEVLGDPVRVAGEAVVGGEVGGGREGVGEGAREAVLEDAGGVNGGEGRGREGWVGWYRERWGW